MASGSMENAFALADMNFLVTVTETAGRAAFTEVAVVEPQVDMLEYRQGNSAAPCLVKVPGAGKHKYGSITLKNGYILDQQFKTWIRACIDGQSDSLPRQTVTIKIISAAQPTNLDGPCIWQFINVWATNYLGPDLDSSQSETVIDLLELAFEKMIVLN